MQDLTYRPFTAEDATAVYQVALEAWRYTYRAIYDAAFIESFVHTHYAPGHLAALVPLVQAGAVFFHVAVHQDQVVGYCHLGLTPRGAELFRLYLLPAYIGRGTGWAFTARGSLCASPWSRPLLLLCAPTQRGGEAVLSPTGFSACGGPGP